MHRATVVSVHQLDAMCDPLRTRFTTEPDRQQQAQRLTERFPLVHRTSGGPSLTTILGQGQLRAAPPCTPRETDCGIPKALYFFLGCPAYPEGVIALLMFNRVLEAANASYTPFDTGSLDKYARPRDPSSPWEDDDRREFLATYIGHGADAVGFAAEYVAAHFIDACEYVRRPQLSLPDTPVYHGLESTSGDRRAWSIEVQLHDDVVLDEQHVEYLVLGPQDLFVDVPDDLTSKVVVAEDEGALASTISKLILGEAL